MQRRAHPEHGRWMMGLKRSDHGQSPYQRMEGSSAHCRFVVTTRGVVGVWSDNRFSYLCFVAGGREHRRCIEGHITDRRLVTEARRFAEQYA